MDRQEEFIKRFYDTKQNFKVEDNPRAEEPDLAVIYFSSLGVYTDENYIKALTSDYYEFHRNPIRRDGSHIYVRDVCRAFYLNGINSDCNNLDKLLNLLKNYTKNYRIVTIGVSAGGYMAMLAGAILRAEYTISESGMITLDYYRNYLDKLPKWIKPKQSDKQKYWDITPYLTKIKRPVFHIGAALSIEDSINFQKMAVFSQINILRIDTAVHAHALDAPAMGALINLPFPELKKIFEKHHGKTPKKMKITFELLSLKELFKCYSKKIRRNLIRVKISRKEKIFIFCGMVLYHSFKKDF